MVCRHLDGDPSNNRVRNLRWGTYSENEADKLRHGTRARGSAARSKLREDQVLGIRRSSSDGVPIRLLATAYGVSSQTMQLGLAQPVGGIQQLLQVVEGGGDLGMVRAIAPLADGQGAAEERLGLVQPVGGPQQPRQVVEGAPTVRWSGPSSFLVMARARRSRGSASSSRFVPWYKIPKSLSGDATFKSKAPKSSSETRSACASSGSASRK
jgi:hypothetical protein